MACCGGSRPQIVRSQKIRPQAAVTGSTPTSNQPGNPPNPPAGNIQPNPSANIVRPLRRPMAVLAQRQQTPAKCPICGILLSVVNIGGKNRMRCANPRCGYQH